MKKQICIMLMALSSIYVCQATTIKFGSDLTHPGFTGTTSLASSVSSPFGTAENMQPVSSISSSMMKQKHTPDTDTEASVTRNQSQFDTLFSIIMGIVLTFALRNTDREHRKDRKK